MGCALDEYAMRYINYKIGCAMLLIGNILKMSIFLKSCVNYFGDIFDRRSYLERHLSILLGISIIKLDAPFECF